MLGRWAELMPLFIVRWIAVRTCERLHTTTTTHGYVVLATARPGVLIRLPEKEARRVTVSRNNQGVYNV